jgi:hypothetical protein
MAASLARGVAAAAAIAAGAIVLSFRPIYEPDLWWHLAQGRENAAGRLVRTNVFSFNYPDYPQPFTPWLFDTTAFVAWRTGGAVGIQVLQACLLALTLGLVYVACRARAQAAGTTSAGAALVVLVMGFCILEPRAIPRPHLISFAGIAACALVLERVVARRSAAPLWWVVPGTALWSNFHVECVFGVLLVGIFALAELVRPSALTRRDAALASGIALAAAVATMANPYGWGLIAYVYQNWSVPQLLRIAELLPPPFVGYRAFYVYVIACAALFAWQWRSVRPWEAAAAVAFAALGLRYLRLTPLVWLVTAPMVAVRCSALTRGIDSRLLVLGVAALGLAVSRVPAPMLFTQLAAGTRAVAPDAFFSAEAMAFAERVGLGGPLFNSHNLGGYIAWMRYPRAQVFQDSRLQAYPPEHFLSILVASQSQRDWDVLVADVDWAVLSLPRPNQLSGVGRFPPSEWATVFRDEAVEVVVRRRGRYGHLGEAR